MRPLRILLTNNSLSQRAGSELYIRDLALALRALGHEPAAYSDRPGEIGAELREAGIPVFDNLHGIAWAPDIIHGQHHIQTVAALLRFPNVPAVYFCHGWIPWQEIPPKFPRILRYVVINDLLRDYAVEHWSVPADRIEVIYNFVDLERFKRRGPLPKRPARALLLSNYVTKAMCRPVRRACSRSEITLDVAGSGFGRIFKTPEEELGAYDLVFAKSRAAMEALAVGAAVVLCDVLGVGPMVTMREFDFLRQRNFGVRAFHSPLEVKAIAREIEKYDAVNAAEVTDKMRSVAGLETAAITISDLYGEVVSQYSTLRIDPRAEAEAAASYVQWLSSNMKPGSFVRDQEQRILIERRRIAGKDVLFPDWSSYPGRIKRSIKNLLGSA